MPDVDVDLDALAPAPKTVKLGGKRYKLPGDMPMGLFLRIQGYEGRVEAGADEAALLDELQGEILALFQVHQPAMKVLPEMGVVQLMASIGAIYGGGAAVGEPTPNRATRRSKKRTPSSTKP